MSDKLICIKIPISPTQNIYSRLPRKEAKDMIEKNPKIRFAAKSAYKKFILDSAKQKEKTRQANINKRGREKNKKK